MIQPAFRKRDPAAPLATTIRPRSTLRSVRRAGTPVSNFARVQGRNRRATRGDHGLEHLANETTRPDPRRPRPLRHAAVPHRGTRVVALHQSEIRCGRGYVPLPGALYGKYLNAARSRVAVRVSVQSGAPARADGPTSALARVRVHQPTRIQAVIVEWHPPSSAPDSEVTSSALSIGDKVNLFRRLFR